MTDTQRNTDEIAALGVDEKVAKQIARIIEKSLAAPVAVFKRENAAFQAAVNKQIEEIKDVNEKFQLEIRQNFKDFETKMFNHFKEFKRDVYRVLGFFILMISFNTFMVWKAYESMNRHDDRIVQLEIRFDRVDRRLDKMDDRFDRMDDRFDRVDDRFDRIEEQLKLIIANMQIGAKSSGASAASLTGLAAGGQDDQPAQPGDTLLPNQTGDRPSNQQNSPASK